MSDLGWRPSVEVESNAGTREVALLTRHLMKRNIFISGEINADMANDIIMQLMYLQGRVRSQSTSTSTAREGRLLRDF